MIQTGKQQAIVVYKTQAITGKALDINGELITKTGRKQAIALLQGAVNPDELLYEVQFVFTEGGSVMGAATTTFNTNCVAGSFTVFPLNLRVTVAQPTATITVTSDFPWMVASMNPFVTLSRENGPKGTTVITVTRTAQFGDGIIEFRATGINRGINVLVSNIEADAWILETGAWRMFRLWKNNGVWKFNT